MYPVIEYFRLLRGNSVGSLSQWPMMGARTMVDVRFLAKEQRINAVNSTNILMSQQLQSSVA
jgi:hypothetical protein